MRKQTALVMAMFVLGVASPVLAADQPIGSPGYAHTQDTAPAGPVEGAENPETWGTVALTAWDVAAMGFSPLSDGQWSHFTNGFSNRSGGTNNATCIDVDLPTGALLTFITTYTNDTDAAAGADITYTLFSFNLATGVGTTPFTAVTTGAPGIQRVLRAVSPAITINNNQNAYALCAQHGSATGTNQNAGATLWYRLQVSPAPATATFADVPVGTGQHRFVEALVAAGITGGCGGGLYCPNDPVTRGQMAVFLSVAFGLHFPN